MSVEFVPRPFLVDTPLGRGYAVMVETGHHDQYWTVELQSSGALVTFQQKEIRVARAYTLGIRMNSEDMKKILGRLNDK